MFPVSESGSDPFALFGRHSFPSTQDSSPGVTLPGREAQIHYLGSFATLTQFLNLPGSWFPRHRQSDYIN